MRALDAKTGNTGFALLSGGVAAYLISKEILILHAEMEDIKKKLDTHIYTGSGK